MFNSSRKHFRFGVKPFGKRFEGYSFIDASDGKSRYVYIQEYYSKSMPAKEALRRRIISWVISVIGMLCFIIAGTPRSSVNRSQFMGLADCLFFLLSFWLVYILIVMLMNKNRLTVWAFRVSAIQYLISTTALAVVSLFAFIFTIIYPISSGEGIEPIDIIGCILRAISSACFIILAVLEYHTRYEVEYPE